jgi:uncharacterized membrane protein (DUF4010 family)
MPVLFKIVLSLLLLLIIFNLGIALFKMVTYNKSKSSVDDEPFKMSRYLGRRLIISVIVVVLIIIALQTGLINPNPRPY